MTKKLKFVFSPTSVKDLQRINEFDTSINVKIRNRAFHRLQEAFQILEQFPYIGRDHPRKKGIQEFVISFGQGNFFIRYRFFKKQIHIAHIWHSLEDEV